MPIINVLDQLATILETGRFGAFVARAGTGAAAGGVGGGADHVFALGDAEGAEVAEVVGAGGGFGTAR